ncbi:MAG TPA: YdeI/OmpD-associated family protein [Minicystis sp.]|nr:YdeI/OmpD-associated family protein [Minicystis sp.]
MNKRTAKRPVAENKQPATEMPVLCFAVTEAWSAWLASRHRSSSGVWVKIAKKVSGRASITYAEALEVALAWGWIDGQKQTFDEAWWLQKFTPRGSRSMWSKINREKATALIAAGKMTPAGLAEVERAKKDGRWDRAYESQRSASVPEDLEMALAKNPRAKKFFESLDAPNRYAVLFRVHHAKKAETRARRIAQFVEMLAKGEKLHP